MHRHIPFLFHLVLISIKLYKKSIPTRFIYLLRQTRINCYIMNQNCILFPLLDNTARGGNIISQSLLSWVYTFGGTRVGNQVHCDKSHNLRPRLKKRCKYSEEAKLS